MHRFGQFVYFLLPEAIYYLSLNQKSHGIKITSQSRNNLFLPVFVSLAGVLMWQDSAADISWDVTPGTVGMGDAAITGVLGNWDMTLGNWTADSGGSKIAWSNAGNDTAVFGCTGGTVTPGTNMRTLSVES